MTDVGSAGGDGTDDDVSGDAWTPDERALLEAALGFYDAAEAVLTFPHGERPQLQRSVAGFDAIRQAMRTLEARVVAARTAGSTPERIARITRIEQETIDLILRRQGAAPRPRED